MALSKLYLQIFYLGLCFPVLDKFVLEIGNLLHPFQLKQQKPLILPYYLKVVKHHVNE